MAVFSKYIPMLIAAEGGYQKTPSDSGNYNSLNQLVGTNHGISAPVYEQWINKVPTESMMRAMTKSEALQIFKAWYWDGISASKIINQSVANIIVDHAVNAGQGRAGKIVQGVLNNTFNYNLVVDGAIGPVTIAGINSVNQYQLHEAIKQGRKDHYNSIGGQVSNDFLTGWLIRLNKFVYKESTILAAGGGIALIGVGVGIYYLTKKYVWQQL
jgi:lysozyme family protein